MSGEDQRQPTSAARYLPPIRDQGQRGTCLAFALTAAHEITLVRAGRGTYDLSEDALFWAAKRVEGNWADGVTFAAAATAIRMTGQPCEEVWPYDPFRRPGVPYDQPAQSEAATWYKATLQQRVSSLSEVRQQLDLGMPVLLGMAVYDTLLRPDPEGKIAQPRPGAVELGYHAVLAVDHSPSALLVRNSWGEGWGLGGYAWVPDTYFSARVPSVWTIEFEATPQ